MGTRPKSLVKGKYRLKLITQLHYQNEFEQEILNRVNFPTTALTKKQREQKKSINAALIFKQKLEEIEKKGGIEEIKRFAEFLLKKVEMITITCTKQNYAIKLFQILNTRGLDLSPADLVKSYLYSRLDEEKKRQQFISTWREIETLSKQMEENITDLLTYYEYYLLAQNPKRSLYEELTNKFKKRDPKKWNEAQADKWLNKLGNLTLLSGRKNIRASNNPFGEKTKIYKGKGFDGTTAFLISQRIIDEKDWTEENVKKRQQWMVKQIENIFGVKLQ